MYKYTQNVLRLVFYTSGRLVKLILRQCNYHLKTVFFSCRDDGGVVSCDLQVNYYSSGYKQLKLLLDEWLPSANVLGVSEIVLLSSRNDNGTVLLLD